PVTPEVAGSSPVRSASCLKSPRRKPGAFSLGLAWRRPSWDSGGKRVTLRGSPTGPDFSHAAETSRQEPRLDRYGVHGPAEHSVPVRDRQQLPRWCRRTECGQGFGPAVMVAFGTVVVADVLPVEPSRSERG